MPEAPDTIIDRDATCGSCSYWSAFLNKDDAPMDLGMCWLISSKRGESKTDLALLSGDSSDETIDFQTRSDFGCNQFDGAPR